MSGVRESLGVLGELVSHIDQVINLKDCNIMKSLAIRYLVIEVGAVLRVFCNSLLEGDDLFRCVRRVGDLLGEDRAGLIDEILRVRDELIRGGGVSEDYLERLLAKVSDLYVSLERSLINS